MWFHKEVAHLKETIPKTGSLPFAELLFFRVAVYSQLVMADWTNHDIVSVGQNRRPQKWRYPEAPLKGPHPNRGPLETSHPLSFELP